MNQDRDQLRHVLLILDYQINISVFQIKRNTLPGIKRNILVGDLWDF